MLQDSTQAHFTARSQDMGRVGRESSTMAPMYWTEVNLMNSPIAPSIAETPQGSAPLPPPSVAMSHTSGTEASHVAPSPLPPPSAVMADEAEAPMDRVAPPSAMQVHLDLDDHGLGHIVNTPAGDLVRRLHIGYDAHQQDKFVGGGGNGCMY